MDNNTMRLKPEEILRNISIENMIDDFMSFMEIRCRKDTLDDGQRCAIASKCRFWFALIQQKEALDPAMNACCCQPTKRIGRPPGSKNRKPAEPQPKPEEKPNASI